MARKIIRRREYYGCTIWHVDLPGSHLPWSSGTVYRRVAADTLEGVKRLIREDMTARHTRAEIAQLVRDDRAAEQQR